MFAIVKYTEDTKFQILTDLFKFQGNFKVFHIL